MPEFLKKIFDFFKSIFSSGKNDVPAEPKKINEVPVEISRKPGLKCPECGTLISVSIEQIISAGSIYCTNCFLELKIDAGKSAASIDALKKLKDGFAEAERIKNRGMNPQ